MCCSLYKVTIRAMAYLALLLLAFSLMILASSQNDTQCVENPTGEVSLNVAVRGIPGPEGPQGPKGVIGPTGNIGVKGDRGEQGEKGERGDTGSTGPQGMKGAIGSKGQKGVRGIQGIPGPVGAPGLEGPIGSSGRPGPEGARGPQGRAGLPGPRGPQGEPGDTVLTEDEFTRATRTVHSSVFTDLNATFANKLQLIEDSLSKLHMSQVQCGMFGNGRRIAYFDTTSGDICPSALRTVKSTTNKTACGRRIYSYGCTSLNFTSGGNYTNVCGKVRGYQYYDAEPFNFLSIDSPYLTGVSVTHGSPHRHLWSYIVGKSEKSYSYRCPCSKRNRDGESSVPSFIGEHFYCESGFVTDSENRIAWEDPLWDGEGCYARNNLCCQRFGWFHRQVASTSDNIEVRWCSDSVYKDVYTDQLEIWVS